MRNLVLSMFLSVDGYIEGPDAEFIGPEWSPDLDQWTFEMIGRFDTLIYGRVAWQQMAAYWPAAETNPETPEPQKKLAKFMNESRKIVFSRTLENASDWKNSTLARGDLKAIIEAERKKPGRDLVVFAGAQLANSVMDKGIIDEFWLLTIPELFGGGSRLFNGKLRQKLRLVESRRMDTGAVLNRYIAT
jgi:dihydrofolate reductase